MNVSFVQVSPDLAQAHCESRRSALALADLTGIEDVLLPEEFFRPWVEVMAAHPDFLGFWVICGSEVIGTGGFKQPPQHGEIEIGYQVHETFWGHGIATELCGVMVNHAFAQGVTKVVAHTLSDGFASQAVLRKNGFQVAGEAHDPNDGVVLRWWLDRSTLES